MSEEALLAVRDLTKVYRVRRSIGRVEHVRGIDGVSFEVRASTTVGIVGESGSGKSTVGRCVMGLTPPTHGSIHLGEVRIDGLRPRQLRQHRRRMQMVFQMPQRSFDPLMSVHASVEQPLRRLRPELDARTRSARADEVLDAVRLGTELWHRHPRELSGGQLQRAAIARALAPEPDLVFLDEPTSALDMSVRGEILTLLLDLRERLRVAFVFVSHDLEAVRSVADELLVMYLGQVVEQGPASQVFTRPTHPYTRALLAAGRFSDAGPELGARSERDPRQGCRLAPRCPFVATGCEQDQTLQPVEHGHDARCWRAGELVPW